MSKRGWDLLKAEFNLDIEIELTHVAGIRENFIRIGSFWLHPEWINHMGTRKNVFDAKEAFDLAQCDVIKRQRVPWMSSSWCLKFAETLGKDFAMLDNDDSSNKDDASITSCDGIEMSTKETTDSEEGKETEMSARETTNAAPNETKTTVFADPIHYPTLAKYGFPTDSQEEINALMRDLQKLQ